MAKWIKILIIVLLAFILLGTILVAIFINSIMGINQTIRFDKEKLLHDSREIIIYNTENELVSNDITRQNTISIEELPPHVAEAFISIEDKEFYNHKGLNYKRIVKAAFNNIKSGKMKEGASTISQQLIKNTHLSQEKTLQRKIKEMLLAKKLERELTKKDILETYLNVIYFGNSCYGIESAAQHYFSKPATELTINESAALAGLINSPAAYSPIYSYENCIKRKNLVLREMLKDNKITQSQYEELIKEELELNVSEKVNENNLYIKACLNEARKILNLTDKEIALSGIKIYSYLDEEKQKELFKIVNNESDYYKNNYDNIADSLAILINNETGGVEAFAGKSKYNLVEFNRQPGSAIKPMLVYAPALEKGLFGINDKILDEKTDFNGYSPNNVGGFHGQISVSDSVALSLNVPAVKIMEKTGIADSKRFAENLGIHFDKNDNGLAIALGGFSQGISLKELTTAYLPFSSGGQFIESRFVKKIVAADGKTLFENKPTPKQVMGSDTAFLVTDMLKNGVKTGTSKRLNNLKFEVAGKTGTVAIPNSNNNSDAISVAYTTQHTMGVWLGNYSNRPEFVLTSKNNGGTHATGIIGTMFYSIYGKNKPKNFVMPSTVEPLEVDLIKYEQDNIICLAGPEVPDRYKTKMLFSKRFVPLAHSDTFSNLNVENFDVVLEADTAKITFTAKDYFKYEIIKENNGTKSIITEVNNKTEDVVFNDTSLLPNTKYIYYVKVINKQNDEAKLSAPITIVTNNLNEKYNKLIEQQKTKKENNNGSLSWYML